MCLFRSLCANVEYKPRQQRATHSIYYVDTDYQVVEYNITIIRLCCTINILRLYFEQNLFIWTDFRKSYNIMRIRVNIDLVWWDKFVMYIDINWYRRNTVYLNNIRTHGKYSNMMYPLPSYVLISVHNSSSTMVE